MPQITVGRWQARLPVGSDLNVPLRMDQNGNVRVLVVGNSGTGKSTMADKLSRILSIPVIHLDHLHWRPNWTKMPDDQFREAVADFVNRNDSWIIDGNYRRDGGNFRRAVGDLTVSTVTTVVWLDPPFALYFSRLILRTFLRLLRLTAPCSPGCNEKLSDIFIFGEDNILWWAWTHHIPQRVFFAETMKKDEGDGSRRWIRLGGWGIGVRSWLDCVKEFAKGQ